MSDRNGNPANHNHLSHAGAVDLARRLREYWLVRGYNITTRLESVSVSERTAVGVRSNLVNGIPPLEARVQIMDLAA